MTHYNAHCTQLILVFLRHQLFHNGGGKVYLKVEDTLAKDYILFWHI